MVIILMDGDGEIDWPFETSGKRKAFDGKTFSSFLERKRLDFGTPKIVDGGDGIPASRFSRDIVGRTISSSTPKTDNQNINGNPNTSVCCGSRRSKSIQQPQPKRCKSSKIPKNVTVPIKDDSPFKYEAIESNETSSESDMEVEFAFTFQGASAVPESEPCQPPRPQSLSPLLTDWKRLNRNSLSKLQFRVLQDPIESDPEPADDIGTFTQLSQNATQDVQQFDSEDGVNGANNEVDKSPIITQQSTTPYARRIRSLHVISKTIAQQVNLYRPYVDLDVIVQKVWLSDVGSNVVMKDCSGCVCLICLPESFKQFNLVKAGDFIKFSKLQIQSKLRLNRESQLFSVLKTFGHSKPYCYTFGLGRETTWDIKHNLETNSPTCDRKSIDQIHKIESFQDQRVAVICTLDKKSPEWIIVKDKDKNKMKVSLVLPLGQACAPVYRMLRSLPPGKNIVLDYLRIFHETPTFDQWSSIDEHPVQVDKI